MLKYDAPAPRQLLLKAGELKPDASGLRQEDGGLKSGATAPSSRRLKPRCFCTSTALCSKARGLEPDAAAPRQLKPSAAAPRQFFKKPGGPKPGVPASQQLSKEVRLGGWRAGAECSDTSTAALGLKGQSLLPGLPKLNSAKAGGPTPGAPAPGPTAIRM